MLNSNSQMKIQIAGALMIESSLSRYVGDKNKYVLKVFNESISIREN